MLCIFGEYELNKTKMIFFINAKLDTENFFNFDFISLYLLYTMQNLLYFAVQFFDR
jgi:hypothetical protein